MGEISLIIRTADKARKEEVTVDESQTCADLIQGAIDHWALPTDTDYTISNVTKTPAIVLNPMTQINKADLSAGDILEIQPVLVAGI